MAKKNIPKKEKMRTGPKPIELDLEQVERLAAQGLTQEQIAYRLGINKSTFFAKKSKSIELSDAVKRGMAAGIDKISNMLFGKAVDGDVTCAIFYLKCRAKWREKDSEIESDEKLPDLVVELTDAKK